MKFFKSIREIWRNSRPIRYLVVGGWNFVFGYAAFAFLYWLCAATISDVGVVVVSNVAGITNSFLCHKFLTYLSRGVWWREYLRFYVVYGTQAVLNMMLVYVLVTRLEFNAYWVQLVIVTLFTLLSYWAHKCYSFKER